jgi:hypothetical protein
MYVYRYIKRYVDTILSELVIIYPSKCESFIKNSLIGKKCIECTEFLVANITCLGHHLDQAVKVIDKFLEFFIRKISLAIVA